MVIIGGGKWRRRQIHFSPNAELRPTPGVLRETLFNWLGQDLTGKVCLDLFAGSGALGLEAASRGASCVYLVERQKRTFASLEKNIKLLGHDGVKAFCMDAMAFFKRTHLSFDIIFLDPPFASAQWTTLLQKMPIKLNDGGFIYLEAPMLLEPPTNQLAIYRHKRVGDTLGHLFKKVEP
jgi:16S rRNA (guanine(966)-N(2))-methyltransferase RsmD